MIAATAFVVFIVLGLACASTPTVPITYTEPSRLNISGVNKIALESNDEQIASEVAKRLSSKFTLASSQEYNEYDNWRKYAYYQNGATEIKTTALLAAYLNPLSGNSLYGNKMLKISGSVKKIAQVGSRYCVSLDAGKDSVGVFFKSDQLDKVSAIKIDGAITAVGRCIGDARPAGVSEGEWMILQKLGEGKTIYIDDAIFPVGNYTGTIDAVLTVKRDFQVQNTSETKQETRDYKGSDGKYYTQIVNVTYYSRSAKLDINYQMMRSRDFIIIGQGVKSSTSNKYTNEDSSQLPSPANLFSRIVEKPLVEVTGEFVPTERTISVTLLKEENNKEAKKEMKEAEKLVNAKDYKNAVMAYSNIYDKYKNFAAGYNQAVLTEATEGTIAAIGLMKTLADQTNENLAKTTLTEMQGRNNASQQAAQQLSK